MKATVGPQLQGRDAATPSKNEGSGLAHLLLVSMHPVAWQITVIIGLLQQRARIASAAGHTREADVTT